MQINNISFSSNYKTQESTPLSKGITTMSSVSLAGIAINEFSLNSKKIEMLARKDKKITPEILHKISNKTRINGMAKSFGLGTIVAFGTYLVSKFFEKKDKE